MKTYRARTQPRKRSPARRRKALPRELDEAARGASFVIAKAGTPVARIVPLEAEPRKLVFGTMKGLLSPEVEQALLDAIEAPLPDDVLASFHIGRLEAPE
jgi:antitoxin (DNA-binding transcriptional repressor) of toxin-antitoxin stability system